MSILPSADLDEIAALAAIEDDDPDGWRKSAACAAVDPEIFFPPRGIPPKAARRICRGCSVRDFCLEDALRRGEAVEGVWAGTTQRERGVLRSARRNAGVEGVPA